MSVNDRAFATPQGNAYLSRFSEREQRNIKANPWINMFLWGIVDGYTTHLSKCERVAVAPAPSTPSVKVPDSTLAEFVNACFSSDSDEPMPGLFGDDDDW